MADTHGYIDPAIYRYFAECDEVWHAGDFGPFAMVKSWKRLSRCAEFGAISTARKCGRRYREICNGNAPGWEST